MQILVEYLEGPFSQLENRWTFHATGEQTCDVEFFIAYEFRSRTLGMLMGAMFDVAFRRFAAAFERAGRRGLCAQDRIEHFPEKWVPAFPAENATTKGLS